jgi:hypothetical protein
MLGFWISISWMAPSVGTKVLSCRLSLTGSPKADVEERASSTRVVKQFMVDL